MYLSWAVFNNIRMLLMACMPIVIFYLIWLINTSEGIRSEEGFLLDLVCWPDGNVIPVIIACASFSAVITELFGLYQLFKAGLPKYEYNVTNGLFYYVVALIVTIVVFFAIMFYSGLQSTIIRAKIKGGISKAMLRYSSHLPSKIAIDRLQTRFHCCGRLTYEEWFYIPWYDSKMSDATSFGSDKFVADNVPYSCCDMDIMWPCIHHGVLQTGTIYKYNPAIQMTIWKAGCEEKLISEMMTVSWRFNVVMALIIIAMILQVVAVRYLHTAYRNGLNIGNQIISEGFLLRSMTDCEQKQENGTRNTSSKNNYNKASSTQRWVTSSYKSTKKCIRPAFSSDSDVSSSEMLLKPIYE